MNRHFSVMLLALPLLASGAARAELLYETEAEPRPAAAQAAPAAPAPIVASSPKRNATLDHFAGPVAPAAAPMPLIMALGQLAPPDVQLMIERPVDAKKLVTWGAMPSRAHALNHVARLADAKVRVDDDGNVTLHQAANEAATQPARASAPSAAVANEWFAPAGETLRNVLARWSAQAGMNLVWNANRATTPYTLNTLVFANSFKDALVAAAQQLSEHPSPIAITFQGRNLVVNDR